MESSGSRIGVQPAQRVARNCRFALAVLTVACATTAVAEDKYRLVDLGDFRPFRQILTMPDGSYVMVGCSNVEVNPVPMVCVVKGTSVQLHQLPGGNGMALGVNHQGVVVGSIFAQHAVYWSATGEEGIVDPLGDEVDVINERGAMAGRVRPAKQDGQLPGIWMNGRRLNFLPSFVISGSISGLNNRDEVSGSGVTPEMKAASGARAFKWSQKLGFQWLPMPEGAQLTCDSGINEAGAVVGNAEFGVAGEAILWDPDGTLHVLDKGNSWMSSATSINNKGMVGGYTNDIAWIWKKETGVVKLSTFIPPKSGWIFNTVWAVDDAGDIAGTGTTSNSHHGFLMIPLKSNG